MKKRVIKADWDNSFYIRFWVILILFELPLPVIFALGHNIEAFTCVFIFMLFDALVGIVLLVSPTFGLTIDYKNCRIKYVGFTTPKFINISEIDHVELKELQIEKKRIYVFLLDDYFHHLRLMNGTQDYIYRNGKVFDIVVYKKDGTEIKYPYTVMYQARSKKRVMKHEAKMRAILDELNDYIASNDRWHNIMSEI